MSLRPAAIALAATAIAWLAWRAAVGPFVRAAAVLGHVYSSELLKWSPVAALTPSPRSWMSVETLGGVAMRVGWWRPGADDRHPAILFVIGAVHEGIEFPPLQVAAEAFARAGYVVVVPELPLMNEERLGPDALDQIAEAFELVRAHPLCDGRAAAFGFSLGGGVLLASAARDRRLDEAVCLAVLGGYFDLRTYIASVASRSQRLEGAVVAWEPDPGLPGRLASTAEALGQDDAERDALAAALAETSYDRALARIDALPVRLGDVFATLSPSTGWARIAPRVLWLHDRNDRYVPVAEAEAARRAAAPGVPLRLAVVRALEHAIPAARGARGQGPRFWVRELGTLVRFAAEVLAELDRSRARPDRARAAPGPGT